MVRKKLDPITRKDRLELDANECQLSKLFGIAELSGIECVKRKEVHHKTYRNSGSETVEDLVTVCVRCHDYITSYVRSLRYSRREYDVKEIKIMSVDGKTRRRVRSVIRISKDQL